jgi:uncharacterized protein (DUF3820 family)
LHDIKEQVGDGFGTRFPFGKYRGLSVFSPAVPAGYLRWLVKADFIFGEVKEAVYRRLGLPLPASTKPTFSPNPGEETEAYWWK